MAAGRDTCATKRVFPWNIRDDRCMKRKIHDRSIERRSGGDREPGHAVMRAAPRSDTCEVVALISPSHAMADIGCLRVRGMVRTIRVQRETLHASFLR